jgi:thioredoxin-like negative regulator of GroEL
VKRQGGMATIILENEKGFDRFIAGGVCLACFHAPWSAPCRLQTAILKNLMQEYNRQVTWLDVNVDYIGRLRMRFNVHNIPTVIVFHDGVECCRLVGVHPESELRKAIEGELVSI